MIAAGVDGTRRAGLAEARAALRARAEARRSDIERAVIERSFAISDSGAADPLYVEGLRGAISSALDYALEVIERGHERTPPPALLMQARVAARSRVGLDAVLRRYFGGYTLLSDFLARETEHLELVDGAARRRLAQDRAKAFDRLIAAVSAEYEREAAESRRGSSEERHAERVERLLAGEPLELSGFRYDLGGHHLGVLVAGSTLGTLRDLAATADARLLAVERADGTTWAWLGARRALDPAEVGRLAVASAGRDVTLAVGEPGQGIAGWRLTHRQAAAALPVALRSSRRLVHYSDVALLASILRDDLLATSLRQLYLAPLERERDGGEAARRTLRAYFAAARNVTSAATALGVNRNTVASRLHGIEQRIGRPLNACGPELEAAVQLDDLERRRVAPPGDDPEPGNTLGR